MDGVKPLDRPAIDELATDGPGQVFRRWAEAVAHAGVTPGDAELLRRQKAILTLGVLLKVLCCPAWVIGYGLSGFRLAAAAPLAYMVLSAASTPCRVPSR